MILYFYRTYSCKCCRVPISSFPSFGTSEGMFWVSQITIAAISATRKYFVATRRCFYRLQKVFSSYEIEEIVESHQCKLRVILRWRVPLVSFDIMKDIVYI